MTHGLKGTAAKLAAFVQEHGTYEFEGFTWLAFNREVVADNLGVTVKTIQRVIGKPPFHHITRVIEADGKPRKGILLKLGTDLCETDHVFKLRAIWVKGLAYYNDIAVAAWTTNVMWLKQGGAPKELYERMFHRIADAEKGAQVLVKMKAGEKISYTVKGYQMGMLRKIVQTLGDDAYGLVAYLVTFEGWHSFTGYLKAEERLKRHYHWPELPTIAQNLDIALQTYLDGLQAASKIDPAESARLLTKIDELKPGEAP